MGRILLRGVEKRFGTVQVIHPLDLEVHEGELLTVLGPSGCGKTTTLRMIAGLETPTAGRIELDGRVLDDREAGLAVPPEHRQMGMPQPSVPQTQPVEVAG